MSHFYAAIDPLALLLPTSVYLKLMDQIHPNTPLIDSLRAVKMTAEEAYPFDSGSAICCV